MTQETLTEPPEQRLLGALSSLLHVAGAAAGLVFWWAMLAERFEIRGPAEVWRDWREQVAERREFENAILATFDDIADLPEVGVDDVDPANGTEAVNG